MKLFYYLCIINCALCIVLSGCRDSSRPKDLPKLYPCEITLTQEDIPLAEALVELDSPDVKFQPATITDAHGIAVMTTYGYKGVPAGKYKVVVKKYLDADFVYAMNESTGQKEPVSHSSYQMCETKYGKADTTPLELTITGKEKNIKKTFDCGKAIKVKVN